MKISFWLWGITPFQGEWVSRKGGVGAPGDGNSSAPTFDVIFLILTPLWMRFAIFRVMLPACGDIVRHLRIFLKLWGLLAGVRHFQWSTA